MKNVNKITKIMIFIIITAILASCGNSGNSEKTVNMATKPMTEQYIIGCMMKKLIEEYTDLSVNVTTGVGGGTSNIQTAMKKGDFDFYPEYTGTAWNAVLKKNSLYDESMFDELQKGYNDMDMTWATIIGFNNTYGIAVTKEIADKYNLKNYSDLSAVSNELTFGAEYDFFEREDGYQALCDTYELNFKDTKDMDIGLKYDAINQKQIDVMNIFTTDGQLAISDIVVLEDNKGLYPSYVCGFVVRNEVLEKYPELQNVFDKVENLITDEEMAELNYKVESEGEDPETIADEYLKEKGLLK